MRANPKFIGACGGGERRTRLRRRLPILLCFLVSTPAIPAWSASKKPVRAPLSAASEALEQARQALFIDSELDTAREQARIVIESSAAVAERVKPRTPARRVELEARFIDMESAALQADYPAALEAALRLCELPGAARYDPRVSLAAARILELAANTTEFRDAIPRIQELLKPGRGGVISPQSGYLRAALIAAATDGAPGLSVRDEAQRAGLLTDWRVAGPFGRYGTLDFDRAWAPEREGLAAAQVDGRAVEAFRFDDGSVALPEYFPRSGLFYAEAEVRLPRAGTWIVRAESPGTVQVFVDGAAALRKDDRLYGTPEVTWRTLPLKAGRHRLLVKFLASAAPFRIAVLPAGGQQPAPAKAGAIAFAPEAAYVRAAEKYFAGDSAGAIAELTQLTAEYPSALADFLLYQAWQRTSVEAPELPGLLASALREAPGALAARFEVATRAYAADRLEDAVTELGAVLSARPHHAAAQGLMAQIAVRMHWVNEAARAFAIQIRQQPSCQALRETARFFASHARYESERELAPMLRRCAPDTLAYAEWLAERGAHAEAAQAADEIVTSNPLNRGAREFRIRELALAGDKAAAHRAAQELAAIAPNSERYRRMAAAATNLDFLLDDAGPRAQEFAREQAFYARWRRDGVQMVDQTAHRRFSGGPAVILLNDRVARLEADGRVALYVHTVTRVLNREGIEKYGEVEIPERAEILELRTVNAAGGIFEPEFTEHKSTISMPALAPGDAVDVEYVLYHSDRGGLAAHPDVFRHTFGSFAAPILYSRFVALTPARHSVRVVSSGDVPMRTEGAAGLVARVWECNDIAQSLPEMAMPAGDVLPTVRLTPALAQGWAEVRDLYRNRLIEATRAGSRAQALGAGVANGETVAGDEQRARSLYRWITTHIRRSGGSWTSGEITPAEDTLAARAGSRTAALIAVARAAGLNADLLLARDIGTYAGGGTGGPTLDAYSRPLVLFRFAKGEVAADAETDGLAFGALPVTLETRDALLVRGSLEGGIGMAARSPSMIVALPASRGSNESRADADLTLDADGNLSADIRIALSTWRAAQMRSILAGIAPGQRGQFFQQLAMRILPGAGPTTGEVRNENDSDGELVLTVHTRAPHFLPLSGALVDMDQLVPALGLRRMYVGNASRQHPLFIDTPLVESATFRLHLPDGIAVARPASGAEFTSEFGSYAVSFRPIAQNVLEIRRSFRIPVQIIPTDRFEDFRRFALRVDDLERQRITLAVQSATSGQSASGGGQ